MKNRSRKRSHHPARPKFPLTDLLRELNAKGRHLKEAYARCESQVRGLTEEKAEHLVTFREITAATGAINTLCCDLVSAAGRLWDATTDYFLKEIVGPRLQPTESHQSPKLREVDALVRAAYSTAERMMRDTQRGLLENTLLAITKQGLLSPEQLVTAGELVKVFVTDLVPYYSTVIKLIELQTHIDVDVAVWESIVQPARKQMILSMLERSNLNVILSIGYARMAFNITRELFLDAQDPDS